MFRVSSTHLQEDIVVYKQHMVPSLSIRILVYLLLERIGHVQKRIGTRLRRLMKEKTGWKLHFGKLLGGKGHFTQSEIDILQNQEEC